MEYVQFSSPCFEHFLKQGHEVVVVSPFDETYQQQLKALGCKVLPIDIEAKGNNPLKDLCTCYHYRQIMIKEKPDYCFFIPLSLIYMAVWQPLH